MTSQPSSSQPSTFFDPSDPAVKVMASMYDGHMVPALFGPWAEALVAQLGVAAGERALDVACGTGAVTRVLAQAVAPGGSVVGVDLSPAMLAVAEGHGLPGVDLHHGDATALPVSDGDFDVAVCQQGLQFVPDRAAAVAEMRRALKPGGRLGVACWRGVEEQPFFQAFDGAIDAVGLSESSPPNVPLSFPDPDALRALLVDAGFDDVAVERQERVSVWPDYATYAALFAKAPPFSAAFAGASDETVAAYLDALMERVEPYRTPRGHEIPWVANVATAVKPAT